jgi:hypothetical protein
MVENMFVMLEDSVIEFLRNYGTVIHVDFGYGPKEAFIVNGTVYVEANISNKYLVKQLTTI